MDRLWLKLDVWSRHTSMDLGGKQITACRAKVLASRGRGEAIPAQAVKEGQIQLMIVTDHASIFFRTFLFFSFLVFAPCLPALVQEREHRRVSGGSGKWTRLPSRRLRSAANLLLQGQQKSRVLRQAQVRRRHKTTTFNIQCVSVSSALWWKLDISFCVSRASFTKAQEEIGQEE